MNSASLLALQKSGMESSGRSRETNAPTTAKATDRAKSGEKRRLKTGERKLEVIPEESMKGKVPKLETADTSKLPSIGPMFLPLSETARIIKSVAEKES